MTPQTLSLLGQDIAFDGKPRLDEIQAYSDAVREAPANAMLLEQLMCVVRAVAPAAINARLRPSAPFVLEGYAAIDKPTIEGVTAIIEAIRETVDDPKLKAALGIQTAPPTKTASR